VVWNRDVEMLVNIEDVSSKTVPRKKKQTVFQRVYAVVTTSKPKRGANVAERPWIVTFRNVSVEADAEDAVGQTTALTCRGFFVVVAS
jgi:hypothetical protein